MEKKKYLFKQLVVDARTGLNPRKNFKLGHGNNYYITIKDIHDGEIVISDKTERIDDDALKIIDKRSRLQAGDVLFSSIGRIGETAIIKEKPQNWNINESVFAFTMNENLIAPEFFRWMFKAPVYKNEILRESTGSTFVSIKMNKLNETKFDIPELSDQALIVDELETIDSAIKTCNKIYKNLNELIVSKFYELFGDVGLNTKGLPIKPLYEIADYWNGLTYSPDDIVDPCEGVLVLRSSNIQDGELAFEDNVYVKTNIKEKLFVKNNDILMCSRNGSARLVGKVALIKNLPEATSFGAFMMIIRSKYYMYLKTYFELAAFRDQIATNTSTINQITGGMMDGVNVPTPDLNDVNTFEAYVNEINLLKKNVKKRVNSLQELLNSKIDYYFGI